MGFTDCLPNVGVWFEIDTRSPHGATTRVVFSTILNLLSISIGNVNSSCGFYFAGEGFVVC